MYKSMHTLKHIAFTLLVSVLLTGCSFFNTSASASIVPTPSFQNGLIQTGTLSPGIDVLSAQVLTNMHLHSWNPNAMTRGKVTGGLFINWKMDNPSILNRAALRGKNR